MTLLVQLFVLVLLEVATEEEAPPFLGLSGFWSILESISKTESFSFLPSFEMSLPLTLVLEVASVSPGFFFPIAATGLVRRKLLKGVKFYQLE